MRVEIRLSSIEDKSLKNLNRLMKKYEKKCLQLDYFIITSRNFGIPLNNVQENIIKDKKKFYNEQHRKVYHFIMWKFDNLGKCSWISEDDCKRIRLKELRTKKINRIV